MTITNVLSKSYGIKMTIHPETEKVLNLLLKDSELPVSKTVTFKTIKDNQESITFDVYENELPETIVDLSHSCYIIEDVKIMLPALPKNSDIRIEFAITENGHFNISAHIKLPILYSLKNLCSVTTPAEIETQDEDIKINPSRVYGIDFGTTNSKIACLDEFGKAVVLRNFEGNLSTPSVVYYESENKVIVGEAARDETDTSRKVVNIKREIGNDNYVSKCIYPEDPVIVTAYILRKLVQDANAALLLDDDVPIKDVVITYPAYFGIKEKMQLKQACEIAGLNLLSAINDPVAAALSYGVTSKEDKVALVYDLGGDTFDVTLVDVANSQIKVVITGRTHRLGGIDWDEAIVNYLVSQFEEKTGLSNILNNLETKTNLYLQAEKVKEMLTAKGIVSARVIHDGNSEKIELTREVFDELTSQLLERTICIMEEMLHTAEAKGYPRNKIDEVLLVGGSCLMPQVKKAVDKALGCDAKLLDPQQAVAKGAVIYICPRARIRNK